VRDLDPIPIDPEYGVAVINRAEVYSLRLSQKVRAIAYRDGDFLRLISLHPDHDSAYGR